MSDSRKYPFRPQREFLNIPEGKGGEEKGGEGVQKAKFLQEKITKT